MKIKVECKYFCFQNQSFISYTNEKVKQTFLQHLPVPVRVQQVV